MGVDATIQHERVVNLISTQGRSARAKDKNDPFKLMGFGHRVYRNIDPRAKEMKKLALDCIGLCGNQPVMPYRVDGVESPSHRADAVTGRSSRSNLTAIAEFERRNCQDRDGVTAWRAVTATGRTRPAPPNSCGNCFTWRSSWRGRH